MMAEYKAILLFKDSLSVLEDLQGNEFKNVIMSYGNYVSVGECDFDSLSSCERIALKFMINDYSRNMAARKAHAESQRASRERITQSCDVTSSHVMSHDITSNHDDACDDQDKDKDKDNINTISKERLERKAKPFSPPSLEDVQAYCKERHSSVDPQKFFEFYQEGNWKDSKGNPVRNWKQKLITWESKENKAADSSSHQDDEWDDFMKTAFNKFLEG